MSGPRLALRTQLVQPGHARLGGLEWKPRRRLNQPRSAVAFCDVGVAAGLLGSLPGQELDPQLCLSASKLLLASLPGLCFDPVCQQEMDRAFLLAISIPLLMLTGVVAYLLRPLPQDRVESGQIFEDPTTGAVFEAPRGAQPERDRLGELAFRAVSYTPWPLEAGAEGERVRIDVGPPGGQQPRTYVFSKVLPQPSQLVVLKLPRPLGIVFEEDVRNKRVALAGFLPGGNAEQLVRRAKLDPSMAPRAPMEGDVLRATTCTNIVYKTGALFFGAQKPERSIVVYGADGQKWPAVITALQKGLVSDGEVTLVLERAVQQQRSPQGRLQQPQEQQQQQPREQQQQRRQEQGSVQ